MSARQTLQAFPAIKLLGHSVYTIMNNPSTETDDFKLCDFPKPVTVPMTRKWLAEKDEPAKKELAELIYHRLHRRYVVPLDSVPPNLKSGFLIMGAACLLIEAMQSFREGREYTRKKGAGRRCFVNFFSQNIKFEPFKPLATEFYSSIRCGILHQAETYDGWRINREPDSPLFDPQKKSINANKFMDALDDVLSKYLQELKDSQFKKPVWKNACKKLDHICDHCQESPNPPAQISLYERIKIWWNR